MPQKIIGLVTSDVADKTITVTVTSRETHPIYGKQYTVTRKYAAHDEKNEAKKGDRVELVESRPFSKRKTWKLVRVIEAGHGDVEVTEEADVTEVTTKAAKVESEAVS